eukprot:6181618-Pleurochrysis_carterae.AAC.1
MSFEHVSNSSACPSADLRGMSHGSLNRRLELRKSKDNHHEVYEPFASSSGNHYSCRESYCMMAMLEPMRTTVYS